jgi:DNA-binding NarL/FixJ family response regulator
VNSTLIEVLIVDDQNVVRDGLALMLGMMPDVTVVGKACDGADAVEQAVALRPDIVLMDLEMPKLGGIEAMQVINERVPGCQVIVLSTHADDESVFTAIRAGARGYLTKHADADEIHDAILAVVGGEARIDPSVQSGLVDLVAAGPAVPTAPTPDAEPAQLPAGITDREADVLLLIAEGRSNAEIAAQLSVSGATVKTHVNHLLTKTGCRDRAQLVGYAFRLGLLDIDRTP